MSECCHHPQASTKSRPPLPTGTSLEQVSHTCPMHPEIRHQGPGSCPKCGMALEPDQVISNSGENPELTDFRRRFWVGLSLAIPIVTFDMTAHFFEIQLLAPQYSGWLQLLLATPVVFWSGLPFFQRAWQSLRMRSPNMFTLIALGTGVTWFYSLIAMIAPGIFPQEIRVGAHIPIYFEAAAVIIVLVLLGQILELKAREQTGNAIKALMNLTPKTAHRIIEDQREEEIAVTEVVKGNRLRIRPGEQVPVDGLVAEGASHVDEAMITGESFPVVKAAGDRLIGGTINGTGSLIMEATEVGQGMMLAQIVQMVAKAQRSQAPINRLADRVSGWFVPLVLVVALLAFFAWWLLAPAQGLNFALIAAVSVLVIACPCSLGLATPMSMMVGIGKGAQSGVLIKDASALEHLARVDTIILDKTGTLTEGRPRLIKLQAHATFDADKLLTIAASLEHASEHPIARAIVEAARSQNLHLANASQVQTKPGQGITGTVDQQEILLGNAKYLREAGIDPKPMTDQIEILSAQGATVVLMAVNHHLAGLLAVADPLKASSKRTVNALQSQGLQVVMLSGDHQATALAVAKQVGITQVHAEILPEAKGQVISELRENGRTVAMVGDGINDAPALALANVGIAMGTGTDIAMESAGITLLHGRIEGLLTALQLSRVTMRNIRQNLFFAFAYNVLGVPIAAGILYPFTATLLSPMLAALAMSLSSVSVVANALRLGLKDPESHQKM